MRVFVFRCTDNGDWDFKKVSSAIDLELLKRGCRVTPEIAIFAFYIQH